MERFVIMRFQKGKEKEFLSIFNENKTAIAGFGGCTYLELRRSRKHPGWFMTFSLWNDQKYLDLYRNSQLFKLVWGKVKPLFEKEAEAVSIWPESADAEEKKQNFVSAFGEWDLVWSSTSPGKIITI
jgi:quinol monooxygenase YgiN